MKIKNIKALILIIGIIVTCNISWAQVRPTVDQKELGSSERVVGSFHQSLATSTRVALPSFNDVSLGQMIEMVAKKYSKGFDPLQVNLDAIEKHYQIKANPEGEAQEIDFSYQISKKIGRIYLYRDRSSIKPYSKVLGNEELKVATRTHPELLKNFGIDKSQLLFLNPNLILIEGIQKMKDGTFSRPQTPLVDNIFTYGQRSVEGIMIEGSYVKVISKDARTLEGLVINWPRFQIHPGLEKFEVKSKTDILNEALAHLKQVANPKHETNVKMAVVFRPVMVGNSQFFIPAMKIGLYSRPFGVTFADEKGENGDMFYVDLMKQSLNYSDRPERDVGTSNENKS